MASKAARRETVVAYSLLAPFILLFTVFVVLPMVLAVVIAFKRIDLAEGLVASPWVGLQNFRDLFENVIIAERVRKAFANTLLFTICFVPINMLVSLVLATLIHGLKGRGKSFYRAAFYLPTVTSAIVFAMIWKWLYDANFGLLNHLLSIFGLGPINWTGDPQWAIWSVIIAALAAGPGANILIYLAAMGTVPQERVEAASVDGANALLRWWTVAVPALRPVTLYLIVLNTIGSFQVFELVFVLTDGGPAGSSTVLVYEIYSLAFIQGRYGIAGALSLILMLMVMLFTGIQFLLLGRDTTLSTRRGLLERMMERLGDLVASFLTVAGDAVESACRAAEERIRRLLRPRTTLGPAPRRLLPRWAMQEAPLHMALMPLALLFLFPMVWMFLSALTPTIYLQSNPPQISPANFSFDNYRNLVTRAPEIGFWFWNSLYLSLLIMTIQVLLSCLTGYVFARYLFPGRKLLFSTVISSLILPGQAMVIPLFIVIGTGIRNVFHVDLMNSHWALILPGLCSPVGVFLMRQYIEGLPRELEESARIDGCGDFAIWLRVVLPLCRPILGAWGILTFTAVWKNFFWPFVVLGSSQLFTLEVGLQTLQQQNVADFGLVMAGATTSAIPMIVLFFIFQKQIVAGLTFGAVKG